MRLALKGETYALYSCGEKADDDTDLSEKC